MKNEPRVDAYISKAQPFAQPILKHLRKLFHQGCPELVENIKWGHPAFEYKGLFGGLAAFKSHASFILWKGKLLKDPHNYLQERAMQGGDGMGNLGKITSLKDLPPDKIILDFIRQAKKLHDDGVKVPKPKKEKAEIEVPDYFISALKRSKKAFANFEAFPPSHKKEYVLWITEAKTETTREKRIETALEWIVEGKDRNWKYKQKK